MDSPILSLIAAMAEDRVIGNKNRLPWHLPADLGHFKALTMGKPMVMGRLTWESLPGALPGRRHIVITRNRDYSADECTVAYSLDDALRVAGDVDEVMIVGGATLYQQALTRAHRIYLTLVHGKFEGDAWFPEIDPEDWVESEREFHEPDERNPYPYSFVTLIRKS